MKVHLAVWFYAETKGNAYARAYAKKRKLFDSDQKRIQNSKWIRGRGGQRLREAWLKLSKAAKKRWFAAHPDHDFKGESNGIQDDRKSKKKTEGAARIESANQEESHQPPRADTSTRHLPIRQTNVDPEPQGSKVLKQKMQLLKKHRSTYHQVVCEEENLRVDTAYNRGNMTGVITSLASGVQNAILQRKNILFRFLFDIVYLYPPTHTFVRPVRLLLSELAVSGR
ncbi:hypothetical protein ON010_g15306 [Phytophthora cinnamomi]|nr:hypothetical protein ON010_g15306 [Phytophthora cinnamomi]